MLTKTVPQNGCYSVDTKFAFTQFFPGQNVQRPDYKRVARAHEISIYDAKIFICMHKMFHLTNVHERSLTNVGNAFITRYERVGWLPRSTNVPHTIPGFR